MRYTQAQRINAVLNAKRPALEQQGNILISNRTARRALAKLEKKRQAKIRITAERALNRIVARDVDNVQVRYRLKG